MRRSNIDKLMTDAAAIVGRLKKAETTVRALAKEYKCDRRVVVKRAILSQISRRQWGELVKRLRHPNRYKVMADSKRIAEQLRSGDATVKQLMVEYHCGYPTLMRAVKKHIGADEWQRLRKKKRAQGGGPTRFKKGMTAWNKGLHYKAGGRSVEARFKKGHIPANRKKLGTVTTRRDRTGTIRMIATAGPTPDRHNWIPYARYLWEEASGPVRAGCLVVHKDGDRLNDSIENLAVVDRSGHMANMKANNPGWRKKAAVSIARTCRIKRKQKKAEQKRREHELKVRRRAAKLLEQERKAQAAAEAEFARLHGPLRVYWQCADCGFDFDGEPPWKCPKCQGLRFVRISQRKTG